MMPTVVMTVKDRSSQARLLPGPKTRLERTRGVEAVSQTASRSRPPLARRRRN
jgi:hypothetical protein